MRQRITFIHRGDDAFDASNLQLTKSTVSVKSLKGAREDRLTFGLHELPQELRSALKQCHELHVRWVSPAPYSPMSPFTSRASPGLHVFFTPQRNQPSNLICPLLHKTFGESLKCVSPEETFTNIPLLSSRFATSASHQYYQNVPSLSDLITFLEQAVCPRLGERCSKRMVQLRDANYVDLDFDTISQSLTVNVFQNSPPNGGSWSEEISKMDRYADLEVGIIAPENAANSEELAFGGFLMVVGEDEKLQPTRFSFFSRHHPLPHPLAPSPYTFTTTFLRPTGLHPALRLSIPRSQTTPPRQTCTLHTYLTLPSFIFPDKYQLSSSNFLASKNLKSVRAIVGETDLEAPDWAIRRWGSSLLVELAAPEMGGGEESQDGEWHADIPLHLRYLKPTESGTKKVEVPTPVLFWACRAEEGTKAAVNPFDRVALGYEGLFGVRTKFFHFTPSASAGGLNAGGSLMESVEVPVLKAGNERMIEMGTLIAIVLGFAWVLMKLGRVGWRNRTVGDVPGEAKKKQ